LISVEQTIELLKHNQPEKKITEIDLLQSLGMVLAQKIIATIPSPPYTNSAMDGFALRWDDLQNTTTGIPKDFQVIGESSAGSPFKGHVKKDQAIRISTGAIVPDDVDPVIPIEKCIVEQDKVKILHVNKQNQHIRYAGEEYNTGERLLDPGIEIKSAHIALIASLGISQVKVYQKPKVIIMTTGSELIPFDQHVERHQLRDSNTPMLLSAVLEAGGMVINKIRVKDDPQITLKTIEDSSRQSDIIISSGGVSMGKHDHVRDMALKAGFKELFWKVKQKPGKPMFLAKKDQTLLIALPGNPVSAYICFKHYVRPLLQSIQGKEFNWPMRKADVVSTIENKMDRTHLMRVRLNASKNIPTIEVLDRQGSHMSSSIAHADGYILLKEGAVVGKGEQIEVFLF